MFEELWYYSLDVTIKLSVVSSPQGNRVLVWAKQCLPEPTKVTFLRLVRGQFAASSRLVPFIITNVVVIRYWLTN